MSTSTSTIQQQQYKSTTTSTIITADEKPGIETETEKSGTNMNETQFSTDNSAENNTNSNNDDNKLAYTSDTLHSSTNDQSSLHTMLDYMKMVSIRIYLYMYVYRILYVRCLFIYILEMLQYVMHIYSVVVYNILYT